MHQQKQQTLLVIGLRGSGKTEIINHITEGSYNSEYYPNNGQDYYVKLARVPQQPALQHTKIFEVQPIYWDEKPFGLISFYSQIANVIFIIVDITSENFNPKCIEEIYNTAVQQQNLSCQILQQEQEKTTIVFCANKKSPRKERNKLVTFWLSEFTDLNQIPLYEINSNNRDSVLDVFNKVLEVHQQKNSKNIIRKKKNYFQRLIRPLVVSSNYLISCFTIFMWDLDEFIREIV